MPNGSDPKQAGVALVPTATIPWQDSFGVPSLGRGIGSALNDKQTVFQPFFEFVGGDNASGFNLQERTEKRAFSSSSNVGVSANVGVSFYSAAVSYNISSSTAASQSNYEFEGFLRLIKERRFVSAAAGHYAITAGVQNFLAQAQQARAAQDWNALNNVRIAFESMHGIGFVSQHVVGYSMTLQAYGNVSETNHSQASSFRASISTPWVGGGFTNEQQVLSSAASAGMSVRGASRGLNTVIDSVAEFYATVDDFKDFLDGTNPNPSTLVGPPVVLWAGVSEYRALPEFAAIYDPIPGTLFAGVDTPIASQTLQLPVLGAVGEMVSLGSYARNPEESVWLSPYLFPGDHSSAAGSFTLSVRPFDLLKQLSRDTQFRQVGNSFLAGLGYHDAVAMRPIIMPVSLGGLGSEFPEHADAFYKPNVQRIRPVLYLTQPGNPNPVRIATDDAHWRLVGPMGLGNFGGPGSSTCGLFFGAGSLTFQFPDPNGEIAAAASNARLTLATEVSRGSQVIQLSQVRPVSGAFGVDVVTPTGIPSGPATPSTQYYTGSERALLVRFPINFSPVAVPAQAGLGILPTSAGVWTALTWQENQDIQIQATGYFLTQGFLGVPVICVGNTAAQTFVNGTFRDALLSGRYTVSVTGFGPGHELLIFGNRNPNMVNQGTFQDVLLLGQ